MTSLNPIEQARSAAKLLQLREQLKSGSLNPIEQVRVTAEALELFIALGGETVAGPEPVDAEQNAEFAADDGLSDDPNAENYRYKDTGYISGSRKELAAESIKIAREAGQMLRVSDIDFKAIEENPRQARELIKKSNLFGRVEWAALKDAGMPPEVGYLIDRLYAAIAPMPSEDNPSARRSYAMGIESIRARLEGLKTVKEVTDTLTEIGDELTGTRLNSAEGTRYNELSKLSAVLYAREKEIQEGRNVLYAASNRANSALLQARYELENRVKRGWRVAPMHEDAVKEASDNANVTNAAWGREIADTKAEMDAVREQRADIAKQKRAIVDIATARNLKTPEAQAWGSLGERFIKATLYRSQEGSDTFGSPDCALAT